MGQINIGYSDFQGQGGQSKMCKKNPQLNMATEEQWFEVVKGVEGVKEFEGFDGL